MGCTRPAQVGDPLPGLTPEERARFEAGRQVFARAFTPEDGLGPLFNGESCLACHDDPLLGGSGATIEIHATRFDPSGCDPLFEEGGPVIQQRATPLLQERGIEREAIPPRATASGERTTPPLFGVGLIDAIPEAAILAHADPLDADGDGISGKANRFLDGRLGRFGRKAFVPTLFEFNAGAFPLEQSVTTPLQPVEETVNGVPVPVGTDPVPEPEVTLEVLEAVTDFTRFLAAPPRPRLTAGPRRDMKKGEELFERVGCATCHVPSMQTAPSDIPALDRQTVFLYSDLLVHDMGPELADVCLGLAEPSEFRTELLMGLRFRQRFLHDGRAATLRDAIEQHGGEAAAAREAFEALDAGEQRFLLRFLESL